MTRYLVTCSKRTPAGHLTHLGGDGWLKTVDRIKDELAIHLHEYYIVKDGIEADVIVINPHAGLSLVRTTLDTTHTNILGNLPPC
jgi:hypothetical protein